MNDPKAAIQHAIEDCLAAMESGIYQTDRRLWWLVGDACERLIIAKRHIIETESGLGADAPYEEIRRG